MIKDLELPPEQSQDHELVRWIRGKDIYIKVVYTDNFFDNY